MVRAQAAVDEGVGKIREGVGFFSRGCRLLGSDLSSAGRLFYRAGAGASLKPREVHTCFLSFHQTLQQCVGTPTFPHQPVQACGEPHPASSLCSVTLGPPSSSARCNAPELLLLSMYTCVTPPPPQTMHCLARIAGVED